VRNPAVHVKVVGRRIAPEALVRHARSLRAAAVHDVDELWCVTDVDEFSLDPAVRLAAAESVNLAISNPCFEVWLIFHHRDFSRPLQNADQAIVLLRRHVPKYDKTRLSYADFHAGVDDAMDRGRRSQGHLHPCGPNPSSGMWRLVELITAAS
jgi:RloB-like protein